MKPIWFSEAECSLNRPESMTDEECGPLPVWRDGERIVSCWTPTLRERLSLLIHGRLWLTVFTGSRTQPPVALWCVRRYFTRAANEKEG